MRCNFDVFLAHLKCCNVLPDVIILTEIWLYDCEASLFSIENCVSFFDCNNDGISGGVMVFIRNTLKSQAVDVHFTTANCVLIKINIDKMNLSLLAIYRLHKYAIN